MSLTPEILDEAFRRMREQDDRAAREYSERVREVAARGPRKSVLGRTFDAYYIKCGPLIVSPQVARAFTEQLERDERAAGDTTSLDGADTPNTPA